MAFKKVFFENMLNHVIAEDIVVDNSNCLIYLSILANNSDVKEVEAKFKKRNDGRIKGEYSFSISGKYEIFKEKSNTSDHTHMIIKKKDVIIFNEQDNNDRYIFYILYRNTNEAIDRLYDKIYEYTSVPIIPEWKNYIYNTLNNSNCIIHFTTTSSYDVSDINIIQVTFDKNSIIELVTNGLKFKYININGLSNASNDIKEIDRIDTYLSKYGDTLCEKIKNTFKPKFNPFEDEYEKYVNYYDDSCYHGDINLYEAQRSVIQAAANNLKTSNFTLISGECGSGKTVMSLGTLFTDYKRLSGSTNIVLCPTHMCIEWHNEILRFIPNSEVYYINCINDIKKLDFKIRDKFRNRHLFLIISTEVAKINYQERPCVLYSKSKEAYVCPKCGQILKKKLYHGTGKNKHEYYEDLNDFDFLKKNKYNSVCHNIVEVYDKDKKVKVKAECGNTLWGPINKFDKNTKWTKLTDEGWVYKEHLEEIYKKLLVAEVSNKKSERFALKVYEAIEKMNNDGYLKTAINETRRYSIAKYIKNKYKGCIDYLIADEIQDLKGEESDRGLAFGELSSVAKKKLALTGTLINGYAKSLFYLLFRLCPRTLLNNGYDYNSERKFQKDFGVNEKTMIITNERSFNNKNRSTNKDLPGVSPLLFTKFLLDNSVFVTINDMADGLPEYNEYPIGIDMDIDLEICYKNMEEIIRSSGFKNKSLLSAIKLIQIYLDMPYNCEPLLDPETARILLQPEDLGEGLRNKENALIDLVMSKISHNEKVLIYYTYVNKTDVGKKLCDALIERGANAKILDSSIKSFDRITTIKEYLKNDINVLICNPDLVKTGLNLTQFNNIIFYETNYNLFTLRQASRRSYRLNQTKNVNVYYMYYKDTVQEQTISIMANKLQAALTIEGNFFNDDGLGAMSDTQDFLAAVAASVVKGIENKVDANVFVRNNEKINNSKLIQKRINRNRIEYDKLLIPVYKSNLLDCFNNNIGALKKKNTKLDKISKNTTKIADNIYIGNMSIFNL